MNMNMKNLLTLMVIIVIIIIILYYVYQFYIKYTNMTMETQENFDFTTIDPSKAIGNIKKNNSQTSDTVAEMKLHQSLINNRLTGATSQHLQSSAQTDQAYRVNRLYGTDVADNRAILAAPVDSTVSYTADEYIDSI